MKRARLAFERSGWRSPRILGLLAVAALVAACGSSSTTPTAIPVVAPDPGQALKPRPPKRANASFDEGRPSLEMRERVVFTVFSIFVTLGLLLRLARRPTAPTEGSRK